jgi:hypothetical protein
MTRYGDERRRSELQVTMNTMRVLKILCSLVCLLLLVGQVWSMSRWNEARGVYDDICYLRQAHLFQRFGAAGLDTDISHDDDSYLVAKLREIGFPLANDKLNAPCHNPMPKTKKFVLQYPPGTGFLLSLFPEGHQVIPLFASATVLVFGFALLGIFAAGTIRSILLPTAFGCLAIYIMINPVKASYSMAPTMVVCVLLGYLTARLFVGTENNRLWLTILLGFMLGLSVNFRLANLFLSSGYFLFFLVAFLSARSFEVAVRGVCFGAAFVAGMMPTLVANAINAGNPFATTYGGEDVSSPDFSVDVILQYVADMQFVLLALAGVSLAYLLSTTKDAGTRTVALITAANLAANLAFFFTHPLVTPYYTVPIAMLSLWTLLFTLLIRAEAADGHLAGRAAHARS